MVFVVWCTNLYQYCLISCNHFLENYSRNRTGVFRLGISKDGRNDNRGNGKEPLKGLRNNQSTESGCVKQWATIDNGPDEPIPADVNHKHALHVKPQHIRGDPGERDSIAQTQEPALLDCHQVNSSLPQKVRSEVRGKLFHSLRGAVLAIWTVYEHHIEEEDCDKLDGCCNLAEGLDIVVFGLGAAHETEIMQHNEQEDWYFVNHHCHRCNCLRRVEIQQRAGVVEAECFVDKRFGVFKVAWRTIEKLVPWRTVVFSVWPVVEILGDKFATNQHEHNCHERDKTEVLNVDFLHKPDSTGRGLATGEGCFFTS